MSIRSASVQTASLAGLGAVVFILCWCASQYFEGSAGISAVWPANALVLAYILRTGANPRSAALALAVAFAAMAAAGFAVGRNLVLGIGFPLANAAEIAMAVWFMRRTAMPMTSLSDLRQFLLGATIAGPLTSALIAGFLMWTHLGLTGPELVDQAGRWLMADVLGIAIVAPFALSLGAPSRVATWRADLGPVLIFLACFLLSWQARVPVMFLAFPLVSLAVLNDRDRGGALGVGAVAMAIVCAGMLHRGPVVWVERLGLDPIMLIQVFLGALVLTVHPLAAVLKRLDVLTDVLERRRAFAEADSAAKSRVLGRVGKDLRSPLTGVVTVAEMLRSGRLGELNDRQRELLARIAESGAEIEALTHEIVSAADGATEIERPTSAVADIVKQCANAARFRALRSGVRLEVLPGQADWRALIDPERLKRLLTERLMASLAAAPRNGLIRVVVGLDDGDVLVTIDDTGADSLQERLAAFAAVTLDPASDPVGADRQDMRRRGGDLNLVAGSLGGAQFRLRLPRYGQDQQAAA